MMATSPQTSASTALSPVSIKIHCPAFRILQLLVLDDSNATGHVWMAPLPVSRVSPRSTASTALASGLGIANTGVMMEIILAGAMILIALVRSAFHRHMVCPNVCAKAVAASNTGQADWLAPIATVAPT